MSDKILYSFRRCPYAIRARLALYCSNTNCELREVSLKNKPQQMLDVSPKGTVPVLQFENGDVLEESIDIVDYVLQQHDPHKLNYSNPEEEEAAASLLDKLHQIFIPLLTRYKYFVRYPEFTQDEYLKQLEEKYFETLEKILSESNFLLGNHMKKIDLLVLPFIRQFHLVNVEWLAHSQYQSIYRWLNYFIESDWFKDVVMQSHDPWKESDEAIYYLS